jgi:hypothetical protein
VLVGRLNTGAGKRATNLIDLGVVLRSMGDSGRRQASSPSTPLSRRQVCFEDPEFDAAVYINSRFPDRESLLLAPEDPDEVSGTVSGRASLLQTCIESLKIESRNVDAAILDAVRRQSMSGSNAREQLKKSHELVRDVMGQVALCKKLAIESQSMVETITKDVQQLDNAKRNLTTAITALRRCSMLVDAVEQLQVAAEKRRFRDAGSLLEAIKQLQAHFVSYGHIPRVAELKGRVDALEQALRLASLREFELLGEDAPPQHMIQTLKDCCTVIGAIGTVARDELVDIICKREMNMYTQIFGTIGETAKLERTVNRYKWFIRRLDSRSVIWEIFPEEWRVTQLLALTYCSITKSELAEILADTAREVLEKDVEGLLKAVEATNVFEAEMDRRFGSGKEDKEEDGYFGTGEPAVSTASLEANADAIKKKYKQKKKEHEIEELSKRREEKRALMEDAAEAAVKHASFNKAISPVFEPYMYLYAEDVLKNLRKNWRYLLPRKRGSRCQVIRQFSNPAMISRA